MPTLVGASVVDAPVVANLGWQWQTASPTKVGIYQCRSRAPTKVGIYQSRSAQPPLQSCDSRASMPRCSLLIAVRSLCRALL